MADAPEHASMVRDPATHTVAPLPGLPVAAGAEPYRPLSLLAMAGFGLAALYAAFVTMGGLAVFAGRHPTPFKLLLVLVPLGAILAAAMRGVRERSRIAVWVGVGVAGTAVVLGLGSLVAYSGSNPWLMPDSMWGVLIAAALVSWVARARIGASENTLSGAELAGWGLRLSLVFGLLYSVYLISNTLAVRSQARNCAEDFLQQLKQGDLLQAFIRTLPAGSRPSGDPRPAIEAQHNIPDPGSRETGKFSAFCRNDLVRMFLLGGAATTYETGSVNADFNKGAYQVTMRFKVQIPEGTFEAVVTTEGKEEPGSGRRAWHVLSRGTGANPPSNMTDEGQAVMTTGSAGTEFARTWSTKLRQGMLDDAYLDTLAGEQREQQRAALPYRSAAVYGLAGLSPVALRPAGWEAFVKGRNDFAQGGLLEEKELWTSNQKLRQDVIDEVHKLFAGTLSVPVDVELPSARVPLVQPSGKNAQVTSACRILFMDPTGKPRFAVECDIVAELPLTSNLPPAGATRIRTLRLVRAYTVSPPPKTPSAGGRPG
jgi:hypothetical protein